MMFDFYPGLSHIGLYIVFREGHIIFTQNHYLLTQEYNVRKRITKHIHYAKFHGSKELISSVCFCKSGVVVVITVGPVLIA